MRLADERGLGVNRMEDIILVTGRHLARSWVRAVFSEIPGRGGAEVSFIAQASGNSVVHLEERSVSGAQAEFGPSGEVGFCTIFKDSNAEISLIRRILESTREPMHIRSRLPRRPQVEHLAKASWTGRTSSRST